MSPDRSFSGPSMVKSVRESKNRSTTCSFSSGSMLQTAYTNTPRRRQPARPPAPAGQPVAYGIDSNPVCVRTIWHPGSAARHPNPNRGHRPVPGRMRPAVRSYRDRPDRRGRLTHNRYRAVSSQDRYLPVWMHPGPGRSPLRCCSSAERCDRSCRRCRHRRPVSAPRVGAPADGQRVGAASSCT